MKTALLSLSLLLSTVAFSVEAPIPAEKIEKLKELRTHIRGWAKVCPDGTITDNECPFGDMTVFAGMLCLSGEKQRCDEVRRSQSPSGEWFRSPGMVDKDRESKKANFSRDQSRGVLAYLIATQDKEAANKWMDFIDDNSWKLCQRSEQGWDACSIRPTWWLETTRVWDYLDLERRGKMRTSSWLFDTIYRPIEAAHQPEDYPMHLTAVGIWLRKEVEKRTGEPDAKANDLNKLVDILYKRWPYNPFMSYLKFGPNEAAADTILKYCPEKMPALIDGKQIGQWIWQRKKDDKLFDDDKTHNELSWDYPGGHDCIFMINLLVGPDTV